MFAGQLADDARDPAYAVLGACCVSTERATRRCGALTPAPSQALARGPRRGRSGMARADPATAERARPRGGPLAR